LILSEKTISHAGRLNRDFIEMYHALKKRQGYSELEISAKREALENVLIPFSLDENIALLRNAGFEEIEIFFKWFNFSSIIALKASLKWTCSTLSRRADATALQVTRRKIRLDQPGKKGFIRYRRPLQAVHNLRASSPAIFPVMWCESAQPMTWNQATDKGVRSAPRIHALAKGAFLGFRY
jgi:hypothetical protein